MTIILSMDKYDVRRYGCGKIRRLIEKVAGENVEVEVFKDTGRVVVEGGNASAEQLKDQLSYKLRVSVTILSETQEPPKLQFSSDDDDDEEEEEEDDTYLQMGSLSIGLPVPAMPEPSWEEQPVADPAMYSFFQYNADIPVPAMPEPSWEEQPVADPATYSFFQHHADVPVPAMPEPSWEEQPVTDPATYSFFQHFADVPSYYED